MDQLSGVLPLLLILIAFLLLFVLPMRQRKRMAERQSMMEESLHIGTPIMMTSGLFGSVAALQGKTVDVEIAPGTVVRFLRAAVMEVRTPPEVDTAGSDTTTGLDH